MANVRPATLKFDPRSCRKAGAWLDLSRARVRSRRLFSRRIRVDSFVPGTEIVYPLPWYGKPVEGKYRVEGYLDAKGGRRIRIDGTVEFAKKRIQEFKRETGRPAVEKPGPSPAFIALLSVIGAAVLLIGIAFGRARSLR